MSTMLRGLSLVMVTLWSCGDLLGIQQLPPEPDLPPHAVQECGECVLDGCKAAFDACSMDDACADKYTCLAACEPEDAFCHGQCGEFTHVPGDLYADLVECRHSSCPACVPTDGLWSQRGEACQACVTLSCSDQQNTCLGQPECLNWESCKTGCVDPACKFDCYDRSLPAERCAEDTSNSLALTTCVVTSCSSECGVGSDWGCVEKYNLGAASTNTWRRMRMLSPLSDGLEDVKIETCSIPDFDCELPYFSTISDDGGWACVEFAIQSSYGRFFGYLRLTPPDTAPQYFYLREPATRVSGSGEAPALTKQEAALFEVIFGTGPVNDAFIVVGVHDCGDTVSSGVTVEVLGGSPESSIVYLDTDGLPDTELTETSFIGAAVFNEVGDQREVTIVAKVNGAQVASRTVRVRPGLTAVYLLPEESVP